MTQEERQIECKSKGCLIANLVGVIVPFAGILYSLPKFMRIYAEMLPGEPLSPLTRLFFAVPSAVYVGLMIGGVALLLYLHFSVRTPRICRNISVAVVLLSVLAFIAFIIAVFGPMTKLVEGPGGG